MINSSEILKGSENMAPVTYIALRKLMHAQQEKEIRKRKRINPILTPLEQKLGVYLEEIEPQVREAVIALNEKGHATFSSGFDEDDPRYQMISGTFRLDDGTKAALKNIDVEVTDGPRKNFGLREWSKKEGADYITIIRFRAHQADLKSIEKQWDEIVSIISIPK